ncbi:MAG TPA: aminopeptidase [Phycisphaerae bacterium]|nr:aminopeptidase [Phycisphaerae bacterium]
MPDPRLEKLADVLTKYSVRLKKGQTVLIGGSAVAEPLIVECYRAAVRIGANVQTSVSLPGTSEIFYKEASKAQLEHVSKISKYRIKHIDAQIGIWGGVNTRSMTSVDPKRMAIAAVASKPITKLFMDRAAKGELNWTGTQFPTHSDAQEAEMSLSEYEDFVYSAGHLDAPDPIAVWKQISKAQEALRKFLNRRKEIRIVAKDTDITLSVVGRNWVNCDGHENFPDGEVFTGPVLKGVNGHIRFSFPAVHHGREVQDAFLEFKNGKVVRSEATKGEDYLKAMIDMDAGSCFLGELAFGTNYNITQYTRNTLFDEKIGGTIHLALGAGYPETGNTNNSGLHWDLVCDTRAGGKVYADGALIQENGIFPDKRFPQPPKKAARRKK